MRVGNPTYYRNTLTNVINLQQEQYRLGKELDTGQRVTVPSDDSSYAVTILTSRYALDQVKQYRSNLESAQSWLKASENSMESMVTRLGRARELAEQVSNGTYTSEQHPSVASEIQRIINDLITLTNTSSNGSYIFGGTNSNYLPASEKLVMANPATMRPLGHNTSSQLYNDGGNISLRLSRVDSGMYSTLQIAAGNTLGQSAAPPLDFGRDNWTVIKQANDNQGQIIQSNNNFPLGELTPVSNQAGESFSWLADTDAGWQTFRTWASIVYDPNDNITINGSGPFSGANADELVNQINSSGNKDFYALLEGGQVKIISCGNKLTIAAGSSAVNEELLLEDFNTYLQDGLKAQGGLTINGDAFSGLPKDTDYVRLGDFKITWEQIKAADTSGNAFASAGDYANALADYLNDHTGQYTATVIPGAGNMASVQIQANVEGKAGNVVVESSSNCITTSGSLYGGMDPMGSKEETPGRIYGEGHSDLQISTTVKGQVVAVTGTNELESVIVALDWIDDDGNARHTEVDLRNGGSTGRVNVPELGPDFYIYRDNQAFGVGDTFEIKLSYLRGNEQEINTLYSENNDMRYNWNAWQVLGDNMRMDLRGVETVPRNSNSGNGLVSLSGFYHGFYPQDLTFDIIDGGELDNGMVLVRASWVDENGQSQQQTVALDSSGTGGGAVLPIIGDPPRIDLTGVKAVQTDGTTGPFKGQIVMSGDYRGLTSCDFDFKITQGGVLNSDNAQNQPVTVEISWIDDQGVSHTDEFKFDCAGENFAVEIPGANGLKFYLDPGEYQAGAPPDTFKQSVIMSPEQAGEGFFFQLEPGTYETGDSFYVSLQPNEQHVLDVLQQWCIALNSGDQELAQTWSQRALVELQKAQEIILDYVADSGARQNRISGRISVLESQNVFHSETLKALQEVDSTAVLLEMQMIMSNYNDVLKVTSQVGNLFILNYM